MYGRGRGWQNRDLLFILKPSFNVFRKRRIAKQLSRCLLTLSADIRPHRGTPNDNECVGALINAAPSSEPGNPLIISLTGTRRPHWLLLYSAKGSEAKCPSTHPESRVSQTSNNRTRYLKASLRIMRLQKLRGRDSDSANWTWLYERITKASWHFPVYSRDSIL